MGLYGPHPVFVVQRAAGRACGLIINHMCDHHVWIVAIGRGARIYLTAYPPGIQPTDPNHRHAVVVALLIEEVKFFLIEEMSSLGF